MEADVIISWNHGPVPKTAEGLFKRPTKFITLANPASWAKAVNDFGWPHPVRGIIQKYAPGVTPMRVAALGFSASCQGVAQLLSSQDGGALDAVVAIDGIHCGYSDKTKHIVNATSMTPWFNFAKLAVVNERLFVDSYSSVVPPNYASTTETADWLWNTLTANSPSFAQPPIPPLNVGPTSIHVPAGPATGKDRTIQYPAPSWKAQRRAGGLVLIGCNNLDGPGTADHIYQAKVMRELMLQAFLAERWNAVDPKAPSQSCFVSGLPADPFAYLGSVQCAGSKILPASFMSSETPNALPKATVPSSPPDYTPTSTAGSSKKSILPSMALVAAGTAGLWWWTKRH